MKDYHINIFYSDEDKGDIADIPVSKVWKKPPLRVWRLGPQQNKEEAGRELRK